MNPTRTLLIAALCALYFCTAAVCQQSSAAPDAPRQSLVAADSEGTSEAPPKADYSKEPYVFEQYATRLRFENDGTGERDCVARVRVQSDAGVQALGELTFGYNSADEQMNIRYVRVRKPDGSVVTADGSAVKEMTAEVERNAPVYTDYKEKRVTVPALQTGDTLEYEIDTRLATPLAAGEFWYAQNFLRGAIVLDEGLEVNLPDGRAVKLASPENEYQTTRGDGRVIYSWKHVQLTHPSEEEQRAQDLKPRLPDVQFTTFKSWGDVAQWYAKLEQGRSDPTPEIRAKVAELTQGKTSDIDKIQPLYDYVSKTIRYVSLSFGLGRYQPHTAGEVLANKYGDCKDKATLLTAMLHAAGISADVALIPATARLDETMPSPSQFDHVITAVPEGNEILWMDSTPEVAPFRMLAVTLRDKSALLVAPDGKGRIVRTPADPPFLSSQTVETTGTVSDLGKLTGTVHYSVRGDQELFLRLAFRHTAQTDWKQIGSAILQQDGLDGDATSVETTDPADTRNPFEITVHFTQEDFLPWASKEPSVKLPLLSIGLPSAAQDNAEPIELGSPLGVKVHLKLTLPASFKARAPVGVAVTRDYADFKSSYSLDGQILSADRTLNFKVRELAAQRTSDYLAFTHAVQSDENQALHLENASAGPPQIPQTAKVADVMDAAEVALHTGNQQAAIPLLQRVLALDPKRYEKSIWNDFGVAYMSEGQDDEAVTAFRKQLEINPYDENSNRFLAVALTVENKTDDAISAYEKQIEIDPLDVRAHVGLGALFIRNQRYTEALPELEKAAAIHPDDAAIETALGSVYLNTGQTDKALEAFDQAVQRSPSPVVWNNVAYELAKQKVALDKAKQYAESAVTATATTLRNVDLAHAGAPEVQLTSTIASYWDTLGWVYFQQGDLTKAERYIRSAWTVDESGTVGDHLGQILAKQGLKDQAADAYATALATREPGPDARPHLILLLGGNEKIDAMVAKARPELTQQDTFDVGKLVEQKADATFEILLSPAGVDGSSTHVDEVKFIKGSDELRSFGDRLRSINFGTMFPDATPVKLVEIGSLSCTASGDCSFVLMPEDIHTQN